MKNSTSTYLIEEVNIVVYDHHTEHSNQLAETVEDKPGDAFAFILLSKIAQKFESVSFLSGGFVAFNENYSDLCSSSSSNYLRQTSNPTLISSCTSSKTGTPMGYSPTTDKPMLQTTRNETSDIEPFRIDFFNRRKKHVLHHSISSYDTNSEFFRNTNSAALAKRTHTATLDTIPHNVASYLSNDEKSTLLSSGDSSKNGSLESPVIREPTKILSYLYLGSQEDALSSATLNALGITNVLNVSINCPKPDFISDAHFLRISVNDGHSAKIRPFFDVAYRFIGK